ncbi:hypothetical protein GGF46_003643 [Coemansia sp. RSA 552]|nr:hypothetical protein GGF46_003643 [Coemansia sp. RSA 552]
MGVMGTLEESGDWSTVTDLELDVANTALNPYDNHDPAYVRKWMGSVVDPMYKHLPNLRYLHFSGSASHQVAHYIYIGIAEKYSGQIKRLRTRQSVSFGNQIRLEQPASLDLRVEQLYPNFHPIRARPDSLVSLKLYWCLKSTFWMMFGDDPTTVSGVLAFPCLKTLDLKALLRDVQPGNPRYLPCSTKVGQLHFPALENLKLKGNPSNAMQILQSSKLPSHMVSIELELHETMLDEVTSFGLPKADRMALETYVQGDVADAKTIHAFSAIGELFKSAGASVEARLQLFNMVPELDFTSMGFDGLTELYLYSSVNSAEVLDILTRMQRLRTAHFCVGNLESSNPVLSVGAFDNRAGPVTPLNSSLRELNTRGMDDGNRGPHLALVKYLLVRLPRLQSYDSINVHFDEVAEFINRNAPLYPHLRQIELSLTPQYPVF